MREPSPTSVLAEVGALAHEVDELLHERGSRARPPPRGRSSETRLPRTATRTSGCSCSRRVSSRSCGPSSRTISMPSISIDCVASGKRTLSEGAREHVRVRVEHGLPGELAGVEHEAEVAVGALARDRPRRLHHLGQQVRVARPRARRRRGSAGVFGTTSTCMGACGLMSVNAMMRSFSSTISAGISRATIFSNTVGLSHVASLPSWR